METDQVSEELHSIEYQTTHKLKKTCNPEFCMPSSEPFRITGVQQLITQSIFCLMAMHHYETVAEIIELMMGVKSHILVDIYLRDYRS
jgi:hypothetical protein